MVGFYARYISILFPFSRATFHLQWLPFYSSSNLGKSFLESKISKIPESVAHSPNPPIKLGTSLLNPLLANPNRLITPGCK
jgi:hypothetical protein